MKKWAAASVLCAVVCASGWAAELKVPFTYPSIQGAIIAANPGDEVVVAPGTYLGGINFLGKAITVRSEDPFDWSVVQSTIIDGNYNSSCVTFNTGEGADSVLEGLTLTGGRGTSTQVPWFGQTYSAVVGGGVFCRDASPTISRCLIQFNGDGSSLSGYPYYGGGMAFIGNGQALVEQCIIVNNAAQTRGSGIFIASTDVQQPGPVFKHCSIANNIIAGYITSFNSYKIQVMCHQCAPEFSHCIISNDNGGVDIMTTPTTLLEWSCVGTAKLLSPMPGGGNCEFEYYVNGNTYCIEELDVTAVGNNISQWPMWMRSSVDLADPFAIPGEYADWGDWHVQTASPCINAGDPAFAGGLADMDGQSRTMIGRVDIGADEFAPFIHVTAPIAGGVLATGSERYVEWESLGGDSVVHILSTFDNGQNWQVEAFAAANTGEYLWTVPNADSDQCHLFVMDGAFDPDMEYLTSGQFAITPYQTFPAVSSAWPTLGYDMQRTGNPPVAGPVVAKVKWQADGEVPIWRGVVVGANGHVHAINSAGYLMTWDSSGQLLWQVPVNVESEPVSHPCVGPDGTIYVGNMQGLMTALDKNGQIRWNVQTGFLVYSTPAVTAAGDLVFGSGDGYLRMLGPDGTLKWSFTTGWEGLMTESILMSPALAADGTVYVGGICEPTLYALNPTDGSIVWESPFPAGEDNVIENFVISPVIADDGAIYVSRLLEPVLYALNPTDGSVNWSLNLLDGAWPNAKIWTEPALGPDGTIYVSMDDPLLRAVSPTGSLLWTLRLGMTGGFSLAVGSDGLIYAAGEDATLYVVHPDGYLLTRFDGMSVLSEPVIGADGTVYVADGGGYVWALTAAVQAGDIYALHRPGDLNQDGVINLPDVAILCQNWLICNDRTSGSGCTGYAENVYFTQDIDRDYYVNPADLAALAAEWLQAD